jgi:hypothetical protein
VPETIFERATRQALAVIKRKTGVAVTYRRGDDSVELTAIRGRVAANNESSQGQRFRTDASDYLIDTADLDFGAGAFEPAIGDEIDDGDRTFEVIALNAGEPCWAWHDPFRLRRRIHARET